MKPVSVQLLDSSNCVLGYSPSRRYVGKRFPVPTGQADLNQKSEHLCPRVGLDGTYGKSEVEEIVDQVENVASICSR